MTQDEFLSSIRPLQNILLLGSPQQERAIQEAYAQNPWFIPDFTKHALHAIGHSFLQEEACREWMSKYQYAGTGKNIGVIMAGNLPLVGFHDLFCVLASGHRAIIKMSEKDKVLPRFIADEWIKILPAIAELIQFTDKLENFDAVIATGSNNSSRYFEYYFRKVPHITRHHRNGVAVLTGHETQEELQLLSDDIFLYFGLGCRSVSRIFVPADYDFKDWKGAIEKWKHLSDHSKYRNNLDYNQAIYIINQIPHLQYDHLMLKEDDAIASRIGCVHYSFYENEENLISCLEEHRHEIQCVVSIRPVAGWNHVKPGQSQSPSLDDYADGIDTMKFLASV